MATSSTPLSIPSSSTTIIDSKAASPQCISLPTLPPAQPRRQTESWMTTTYYRKIGRNVMAMATGEAPAWTAAATQEKAVAGNASPQLPEIPAELSEILQNVQNAWEKVEDKYAAATLGGAALVALWGSVDLISAIDRLPVVPGLLELVGIGYTGWFAYKNVIFKPDREALIAKIKELYNDTLGSG